MSSTVEKLFSCDNISHFIGSIRHILPYQGVSESKFFMCEHSGVEFLTKLSFYKKTAPEIYSKNDDHIAVNPHDAEIGILRILKKKIIDANVSPCILELIHYKKCSGMTPLPTSTSCDKLLSGRSQSPHDVVYSMFCKHNDLIASGLAHKRFSFLILEECDITFHDFIVRYVDSPVSLSIFKSLLFQIIFTFHAISSIYPDFKHSDLHTENVMLKVDSAFVFDITKPQYLVFSINGIKRYVPYFGIICKIIDFGFASIPEENIRSYVSEDRHLMYLRSNNDLLFLFYDIYSVAGANDSITNTLRAIEPNETFVHHNTAFIRRNETLIPSYHTMATNPIFDEYIHVDDPPSEISIIHTYTEV